MFSLGSTNHLSLYRSECFELIYLSSIHFQVVYTGTSRILFLSVHNLPPAANGVIMNRDGGTCPDQLWERKYCPYKYFDLLFIVTIILCIMHLIYIFANHCQTRSTARSPSVRSLYLARWARTSIKYRREPLECTRYTLNVNKCTCKSRFYLNKVAYLLFSMMLST